MATSFCISLSIGLIIFLSNETLRSTLSEILKTMFQGADIRQIIVLGGAMIFGLLIQFGIWYLFITLGNKQMVKALEMRAKK